MHDPTTSNRQGPDTGSQYRSAIFYHDAEQESTAKEVTKLVNEKWWKGKVVTEILEAGQWWDAEAYHQEVSFSRAIRGERGRGIGKEGKDGANRCLV